jgi:hypothetical protein
MAQLNGKLNTDMAVEFAVLTAASTETVLSSGLQCLVDWWKFTNVSEVTAASITSAIFTDIIISSA